MNPIKKEDLMSLLDERRKSIAPEEAAQALGGIELYPRLIGLIAELEREGRLIINKKGRILSSRTAGMAPARIISVSPRFAFARKDGGGDLYISERHLGDAMLRDRVLLTVLPDRGRGEAGKVEKVLERGSREFTGTLSRSRGRLEILPDDKLNLIVPLDKKKARGANVGDKVLFTLVRDRRKQEWKPVVQKVYGKAASARVCADAILDGQGIPGVFSGAVIAEAKAAAEKGISESERGKRLDLREETIFTIDGSDAKDLDDAISVEKTPGGYTLGVHIADVSHYVRPGTELDTEAQRRGTSVYFADRVVPMLPTALSNGSCSLSAGEDKLTFSCLMQLDRDGKIERYEFHKSVIRSRVRGVYSEINRVFAGEADQALWDKYSEVMESLEAARELAERMKLRAQRRGFMELESRESRFILNEEGVCVDIRPRIQGLAEEMIEQFMIAANRSAAEMARKAELPFVYRVHEPPDPEKLAALAELSRLLGFDARGLRPGVRPADLAELLEKARETKYARILSDQVLRTMSKARYDAQPLGHFGLSLSDYCHFTSPIRRYPDLAIHRIMGAKLSGQKPSELVKRYGEYAGQAARESSVCEVRAQTAERMAEDVYAAEYMRAHLGEEYEAVICGVTQRGLFVELESSVEGYVSAEDFPPGYYTYDGQLAHINRDTGKKLTVGEAVRVRCVAADVATARIDFIMLKERKR